MARKPAPPHSLVLPKRGFAEDRFWLPGGRRIELYLTVERVEKVSAAFCGLPGLIHQRLAQRVVTSDQELVSRIQPLKQRKRWDTVELPSCATVASLASEHEVPDPIKIHLEM
ncbi:MAG: hypothetical protein ACKO3Q_08230 [Betaproteobacteria bacterium]